MKRPKIIEYITDYFKINDYPLVVFKSSWNETIQYVNHLEKMAEKRKSIGKE